MSAVESGEHSVDGATTFILVLSNSSPGMDAEYNRWYDEIHLPENMETLPGALRGRRFTQVEHDDAPQSKYNYATVIEVADELLDETLTQFQVNRAKRAAALAEGREIPTAISPAMDPDAIVAVFRQRGPAMAPKPADRG